MVAKTLYFPKRLLFRGEYGRDMRFKAQSLLRWFGEKRDLPERIYG
jgi:hypothetical protein